MANSLNEGSNTLSINENELRNGVYLYQIIINDKIIKTDKLVIIN
ncbi:MAG: T9SS type A sorting domain-containing protein [Bacteroidota bacterium]